MEYITTQEAAERWGLSVRRVQYLCQTNMIPKATRIGRIWMIPKLLDKPQDMRLKEEKTEQNSSTAHLLTVGNKEDMLSRVIEGFPYAIQIYAPDGTLVHTNDACLQLLHIPSKEQIIGKFNVLSDHVIDKWGEGVREAIIKSFEGHTIQLQDLQAPIQEIMNRFDSEDLNFNSSFFNITCFPIFDESGKLMYVVHVFVTSKVYNGKLEMVKAMKYIDQHWMRDFDLDEVARSVHLSRYHFCRMFKKYTSMTPFNYYQNIKISKIKEKLLDKNLSIQEAFSACGVDYNGNYARLFREKTGMTPTKFRNSMLYR